MNASDNADVFLVQSTDGGVNWTSALRVYTDGGTNDQWMPTIAVRPDGNQLFIGWLDRRNDTTNCLIDVYGCWGSIATNGTVSLATNNFRITTTSFPPAFPGSLLVNTNNGHYDPVWPPGGLPYVNLHWWYAWFPEPPEDPEEWELGYNATWPTYCGETGEHNGAYADMNHVYFVWSDNRSASQGTLYPSRKQADIRLARLPWPP